MKKCNALFLLLLILSCLTHMVVAALGPNLSPDPGFEQKDKYWRGKREFDSAVVFDGQVSAKLNGVPDNHWIITYQDLPLVNGQEYLIKIWCRISGTGSVKIGIRSYDSSGISYKYSWHTIPTTTQDEWFEYETSISTPTDRSAVGFQVYLLLEYFTGQVWFDNFSIQEDDEFPPNLPRNLEGERTADGIKLTWLKPEMASDSDVAEGGYNIYCSTTQTKLGSAETFVEHISASKNFWWHRFSGSSGYYYCVTALDNLFNESAKTTIIYVPGFGSLSGYVFDNQGSPIPNANIAVNDLITTSDVNGYYELEQLKEGTCEIKVSSPGYKWNVCTIFCGFLGGEAN